MSACGRSEFRTPKYTLHRARVRPSSPTIRSASVSANSRSASRSARRAACHRLRHDDPQNRALRPRGRGANGSPHCAQTTTTARNGVITLSGARARIAPPGPLQDAPIVVTARPRPRLRRQARHGPPGGLRRVRSLRAGSRASASARWSAFRDRDSGERSSRLSPLMPVSTAAEAARRDSGRPARTACGSDARTCAAIAATSATRAGSQGVRAARHG